MRVKSAYIKENCTLNETLGMKSCKGKEQREREKRVPLIFCDPFPLLICSKTQMLKVKKTEISFGGYRSMGYKQKPFVAWPNREWDLDF